MQTSANNQTNINVLKAELARREIARRHILDFTKFTMSEYEENWHHVEYANKLDEFVSGRIKKLMVFMPPQHGKSELSTRRTPAFLLGRNPDLQIAIVAYAADIAKGFNRDIQRIIDDPKYQLLFPKTTLDDGRTGYARNTDLLEIVNSKGRVITVGVGGPLTSKTVDILVMDDLYKGFAEACSEATRTAVSEWYWSVAKKRLHNDSQQLLVFTRWHEEDLAGELLRKEKDWEVIFFERIKERSTAEYDKRQIGEVLWEKKHSLADALADKKSNPIVFDALEQQNPTPKEGLVIAASDLKRFRRAQIKDNAPTAIVLFCDVADEGDDSLCAPVGYMFGKEVYITDLVFTQQPIEITQPRVAALIDKHNVNKAMFESNNGGKGFAQKVKELIRGRTSIGWRPTVANKHTRIIMSAGQIKEHFHFLVEEEQSEEYRKYFYELTHYPLSGKVGHDDAIDGTTGLNEMLATAARPLVVGV